MPKVGKGAAKEDARDTTYPVSLLRSKLTGQVLFLEAGKDFVDLLLSFLLLPVGTILHMLSNGSVQVKPWCGASRLFESVLKMDSSLLLVDKRNLVEPTPAALGTCVKTGLLQGSPEAANTPTPSKEIEMPGVYYRCSHISCASLSFKKGTRCNYHYEYFHIIKMLVLRTDNEELAAVLDEVSIGEATGSRSKSQGYVKECITYMVTDSLEILPSTTIGSIKVLNKLKVATLGDLESSDTSVTIKQVLQLLHSALTSKSCLNDVFGKI